MEEACVSERRDLRRVERWRENPIKLEELGIEFVTACQHPLRMVSRLYICGTRLQGRGCRFEDCLWKDAERSRSSRWWTRWAGIKDQKMENLKLKKE
jgi:hypothetical protein